MAKFLVVEDDPTVPGLIREWLGRQGHEVVIATDGNEGLEAFRASRPTASIIDVHMPGLDGFSLLDAMRKIDPQARVVVMSGVVNRGLLNMAYGLGARAVLHKPFTLDGLDEAVRKAVGGLIDAPPPASASEGAAAETETARLEAKTARLGARTTRLRPVDTGPNAASAAG